jgi:cardiolipin synthase
MSASSSWTTRANALTALRILTAPALCAAVWRGHAQWAGLLFAFAVATDFADGWVARRFREASPLGSLIDHGADALFVIASSTALAVHGELPAWLPVAILFAFTQYVVDSRPGPGLRGSWLGRWNGIAYFVAVGIPVVRDALRLHWPPDGWVRGIGWLLVATTVLSVLDRLRHAGLPGPAPASDR